MPASTPSSEVKLLKDENWKLIQQNTFTRWVNQHLKQSLDSPQIDNLETAFADGIILIKLSQVLSGRNLPRYNKKPTMRTQKLDNISLVLNFLQKEEGIKIVNIDSSHIVDRNLKLILGLVWTLILHYSLSHRHFSADDENTDGTSENEKKETPKQRLLAWIQAKLPHHPVSNFTSNWNNGILLGALVDACLGGRFGGWREWDTEDAIENTQKAMQVAEQALGIETLITPEELTNPSVDEKSVMTYLSQFPRAQPQQLGQISELDRNPLIGIPTTFVVQFDKPYLQSEIIIVIMDPHGRKIPAEISLSAEDPSKHEAKFVPTVIGKHKVNLYAKDVQGAQESSVPIAFTSVHAIPTPQVIGLDNGMEVNVGERRRFQVTNVSEHKQLDVFALDPQGKEIILDAGSERDQNSVTCCYTPKAEGEHLINVLYKERHIPGSPFGLVALDESIDPAATIEAEEQHEHNNENHRSPLIERIQSSPTTTAKQSHQDEDSPIVWGRGILPKGTGIYEEMTIHVDNCPDPVQIIVKFDKDGIIPVKTKAFAQPFNPIYPRQSFVFMPKTNGKYEVDIQANNIPLGKSPYKVMVGPKNMSTIHAVGPGLEGGVVDNEAVFYVDTHGKANQLEFAIEGPSETQIHCEDRHDGTALVKYTPKHPGRYTIKIVELDTNTLIMDAPFVIWVEPADSMPFPKAQRPLKIPPEENADGQVGKVYGFTVPKNIDAETLNVDVYDPNLNKMELISRIGSQAHHFSFKPEKEGTHIISVVADKLAVDGWPFHVSVSGAFDAQKVWLSGPGLSSTIQTRQKTNFTINARAFAQAKRVEVKIADPMGQTIQPEVDLRDSALYNVRYEPIKAGVYQISLYINEQEIFVVPVHALDIEDGDGSYQPYNQQHSLPYTPDLGDSRKKGSIAEMPSMSAGARISEEIPEPVVGMNTSIVFNCPGQHSIDGLKAKIWTAPNNHQGHDMKLEQIGTEQFRFSFVPKHSGLHTVEIDANRKGPIEGSPFKIPVALLGTQNAHMAWANGPGLTVGIVGSVNQFTVWNAKELKGGEVTLAIDGPAKATVNTKEHPNENACQIEYTVQEPGLYTINVLFNDAPISGSPFKVFVKPQAHESLISKTATTPKNNPLPVEVDANANSHGPAQIIFEESSSSLTAGKNNQQQRNGNGRLNAFFHQPEPLHRHPEMEHQPLTTAMKKPMPKYDGQQQMDGDARMVQVDGRGLEHFVPGEPTEFVVDTSKTGINTLFVAVVTSNGPTDELNVRHIGNSKYMVTYNVPYNSEALVYIKYGDVLVNGSPFCVNPVHPPQQQQNGHGVNNQYFSSV